MIKKHALPIAFLLVALLFLSWRTLPQWLPRIATIWLPTEMSLVVNGVPGWQGGGPYSAGFSIMAGECQLVDVRNMTLRWHGWRWHVAIDAVTLNSDCLQHVPASSRSESPAQLAQWQQRLPAADIQIKAFTLLPWQDYAGQVRLSSDGKRRQTLDYQGDQLVVRAELNETQLTLHESMLATPAGFVRLQVSGEMTLADTLDAAPIQGRLTGKLDSGQTPDPLSLLLDWHHQAGELVLNAANDDTPLISLPWQLTDEVIQVTNGVWRWPYADQPLSGQIAMTLQHWRQGLDATTINARLNMLTQGHNGKANAVLVLGPGNIGLLNSELRFQLTGQANLPALSLTATLPGVLQGSILNPELALLPGALLRAWGTPAPQVYLEEARWPLAGVRVSATGVNGRLQAIVKAREAYWGRFNLHLDGQAQDFWPDQGQWQWRYWGNGHLPPLKGQWDVAGRGQWQDTLLEVSQLSSGLDQLGYGIVTVHQPRLTITEPIRWQRARSGEHFQGALQLASERTHFSNGGYLPPSLLTLAMQGRSPDDFQLQGQLQAEDIGPVRLRGRWDGERLRGGAWWPTQPLKVFQPLLSPQLKMNIRAGQFYAQAAFSAARKEGFSAGGHWVVKNGGLWLQDGEVSGVNFVLPYRLKDQRWQLGVRQPVTLRIDVLDNLFRMSNIRVDLQGFYPYSERRPLIMSQADMDVLDGHIGLSTLRWPQREPALFTVKSVDLSELLTVLKQKQFALSGRVSGTLPLNFNHPTMLIEGGRITNDGFLTLRLDNQLADELASKNLAGGAAIGWLRYLEIGRSYATLDLSNQGELTLASQVQGKNPQLSANRQVILNYRHQENIFQLWRSLRFGDNLRDTLEQQANE
ncbi:YdbH family protein [Pectobacterium aroidearum]|uniref:YdbH family protein n=1 Tax=Pectobacterium aroidearum TaxID=1201031 RepID=UPI0021151E13|nr:YdbH family protein [Pectobacterium aroidearum]UUE46859.1 YdbH family protein [Pectobacterium aroidearum]UUE51056.1 YdbH family protein [Pectobacterium aroidearum]UUE55284.1 YdbH family protein [Pectobacterium aroidearum]UUE63693.1 YdbH family protein [Pectobacterium aroidearum]UUE67917.1 YdbH family protein [Pectobacterium aroidearum]